MHNVFFPYYELGSSNYSTFIPSSLKPTPVSLSGATYGLDLELSVDSMDSVIRGLTKASGVNLVIHEAGMYPLTNSKVKNHVFSFDLQKTICRDSRAAAFPQTL